MNLLVCLRCRRPLLVSGAFWDCPVECGKRGHVRRLTLAEGHAILDADLDKNDEARKLREEGKK